jgi:hypothetical protein
MVMSYACFIASLAYMAKLPAYYHLTFHEVSTANLVSTHSQVAEYPIILSILLYF